ncbi:MAG: hypothetical protein IKF48_03935 [Oscillospiraceae bacterium]|nr:hypothetical protein [Oscillospiraceae bacterium]
MNEIPAYELKAPYYVPGKVWTSPFNYDFGIPMPEKATIYDVTLRDGDQTPGVVFREDERVRIAQALAEMGLSRIEAGMPVVSKEVENSMRRMVDMKFPNTKIYAFNRAVTRDVELSADIGVDGSIIEYLVNPEIIKYAYHDTMDSVLEKIIPAVNLAKDKGMDVAFMGWDWFRSPIEFTRWLVGELYERTALDGLVMVDTFGCATPDAVGGMFRRFKDWFPRLRLEFHGHNDLNLANANALAALANGADVVHGAILGLGDRCGNTSTEEMAVILECHKGVKTGLRLDKIASTASLVSSISGVKPHDNKPVLGTRPFLVEAGVGIDLGYKLKMQNREQPQFGMAVAPAVVGRTDSPRFVLGKSSGKSTIRMALLEHGLEADDEQVKEMLRRVIDEAIVTKSLISDAQFLDIYHKVCG